MTAAPHLSHSQLETLATCELQWYYRYVEGIKSPPGIAQVIGKGTHGGIEVDLERKMSWGSLATTEEVADATADCTRRIWDRDQPQPHRPRAGEKPEPDRGQAVDIAVRLADLYHREVAPGIEPIAVEEAFAITVPGLPYEIHGVVDVETPTHIRDTKTKSKRPHEASARRSTQLALYHLRGKLAGGPDKKVAFDYLIKSNEPAYVSIETQPTSDDHVALLKRFELAAMAIKAGVFKPTSPGSWVCSERFCGYWDRCDFGSKKQVSVQVPVGTTTRVIERPSEDATAEPEVD